MYLIVQVVIVTYVNPALIRHYISTVVFIKPPHRQICRGFQSTAPKLLSILCTTFTPQIKGIPEDTFAMYTFSQGCN